MITGEVHTDALTAYLLPSEAVRSAFFVALHTRPQAYRCQVLDIYQELRCSDIERSRCGAIRDEQNT